MKHSGPEGERRLIIGKVDKRYPIRQLNIFIKLIT